MRTLEYEKWKTDLMTDLRHYESKYIKKYLRVIRFNILLKGVKEDRWITYSQ